MSREIKYKYIWSNPEKTNFITEIFTLDQIEAGNQFMVLENEPLLKNYKLIARVQFTGLLDKNGKEIYEGDLLKRFGETKILICDGKEIYSPHWEISKAVFVEGCFQVVILAQENKFFFQSYFGKIPSNPRIFFKPDVYLEVIGNIYENPELLGGEND